MNGVLAKPFTKEGMIKSVKTHLSHLLKNPPEVADEFMMHNVSYMNAPGLKFEASTSPGGPGASGWSPSHMTHGSVDQWSDMMNGGNQFNVGRTNFPNSDNGSPPEKRQRLNQAQSNYG